MKGCKPYDQGYDAMLKGIYRDKNPYPFIDEEGSDHQLWISGWYDAQDDYMTASHEFD